MLRVENARFSWPVNCMLNPLLRAWLQARNKPFQRIGGVINLQSRIFVFIEARNLARFRKEIN